MERQKRHPLQEKPRELSKKFGYQSLGRADLLALVLKSGTKYQTIFTLSKRLAPLVQTHLAKCTDTQVFLRKLREKHLLGEAQQHSLCAVYELLLRTKRTSDSPIIFSKPSLVAAMFQDVARSKIEKLYCLYLSPRLELLKKRLLSRGTVDSVSVPVRDLCYYAIKHRSRNIILVHNHPSGDAMPSREDVLQTKRIIAAGELLSVTVIDHVIVTTAGFYSFKESKNML